MQEKIREVLNKYFGYEDFRTGQKEAMLSVLKNNHTLVVMPTGSGKSLCYQIPGMILDGITIVVSPLISLMKDQVDSLRRQKIKATFLNSSLEFRELNSRISEIRNGIHKFVYVAPERFENKNFQDLCADLPVSLFVVDEAHCISEWGHDFRPSYRKIHEGVKLFKNPVIMALTATATPEVQNDIIEQLEIKGATKVITGFDRPNLSYSVFSNLNKLDKILQIANNVGGSGIIYAGTRKNVEKISQFLNDNHLECLPYHAGLKDEDRILIQNKFISDEIKIISATNAFGMGIDKPNIRFVIHYDIPSSIEQYYQEAGRAGRDGLKSYCVLLFNQEDRELQKFFIYNAHPTQDQIRDLYDYLYDYTNTAIGNKYTDFLKLSAEDIQKRKPEFNQILINSILNILEQYKYLEQIIANRDYPTVKFNVSMDKLKHYSDITPSKQIKSVIQGLLRYPGNMAVFREQVFDLKRFLESVLIEEKKLLEILSVLQTSGYLVLTPPLKGKGIFLLQPRIKSYKLDIDYKKIQKLLFHNLKKFDMMEDYTETNSCRRNYILNYFGESDIDSRCGKCDICINIKKNTEKKVDISSDIIILQVIKNHNKKIGVKTLADLLSGDRQGYKKDNTLFKSNCYGILKHYRRPSIIKMILELINNNYLSRLSINENKLTLTEAGRKFLQIKTGKFEDVSGTASKTYELYSEGCSIPEIAKKRNLCESTISKHFEELIEKNYPIKPEKLITHENQKLIENALKKEGTKSLKEIKNLLDAHISYQDIRLTRAFFFNKIKKEQNI